MKNTKELGSKKFWMILSAMLGAFILIVLVFYFIINPYRTANIYQHTEPLRLTQNSADNVDYSFEATKDRVNSVNQSYGQQIKSAYSGNNSVMEQMMKQRMVTSTIKNILLCGILILVILLILVKGFNIALFKKKLTEGGEEKPATEQKPTSDKKEPVKEEKVKQGGSKESVPKPKEKETKAEGNTSTEETEIEETKEADVQEVVSGCKLP